MEHCHHYFIWVSALLCLCNEICVSSLQDKCTVATGINKVT